MHTCSDLRTSREPVVAADWYINEHPLGWRLTVRHRHVGGLMTDCPPVVYGPYSHAEMSDVLGALWDELEVLSMDERPF